MTSARMAGTFGQTYFGGASLGDARRTARLVLSADALLAHPGGTLPQKLSAPGPLKGFYRLMNRPEVTHASVLAPAIDQVRALVAAEAGGVPATGAAGRPAPGDAALVGVDGRPAGGDGGGHALRGRGRPRGGRVGVSRRDGGGGPIVFGAGQSQPPDRPRDRGPRQVVRPSPGPAGGGSA